jgi:hypothetical protein
MSVKRKIRKVARKVNPPRYTRPTKTDFELLQKSNESLAQMCRDLQRQLNSLQNDSFIYSASAAVAQDRIEDLLKKVVVAIAEQGPISARFSQAINLLRWTIRTMVDNREAEKRQVAAIGTASSVPVMDMSWSTGGSQAEATEHMVTDEMSLKQGMLGAQNADRPDFEDDY